MKVHALRNIIEQAPNGAPVIVRTASADGSYDPRELIHAEFGHVPDSHLTLIVAPENIREAAPPTTPAPATARLEALREITSHIVNPANDAIRIEVLDAPGAGGASHVYRVQVGTQPAQIIAFQNGPIAEAGINGLTQEVLLAIVVDRLECFQRGPFACKDNEDALGMIKGGLTCLLKRTRARMAQGVEGTHEQHVEADEPAQPGE